MADKIEIFKLDIDVDAVIESQSDLKKSLDQSKAALDAFKESGDTSSESYVRLQAKVKNLSREYNAAQTQLGKMIDLQGKEIKTVEEGEAALTIINKEWAKQAQLYGVNSKEADDLAKKHAELKERTRELRLEIGDTSTNIGNYAQGFKEAIGQSSLFAKAESVITDVQKVATPVRRAVKLEIQATRKAYADGAKEAQAYTGVQKAVAVANNATSVSLRVLKVALISTGIGAILVLLGSLVAWFSKTQAGIDLVNKALAGLSAGFDVIIDRLSKVGGALVKLASGDFAGAFNDIKEAATGLGDELLREITLAVRLEQVLQDVAKAEVNLDIRRAAANSTLKELNKTIEDTTKSTDERIKAAQNYAKIEEGLVAEEVANQEKRVAAMLGFAEVTDEVRDKIRQIGQEGVSLDQLGLSESTLEDAKEFRDEITKLFDVQTRSYELQTTNQNKLNTLLNEEKRKREEANKAAIAAAQKATDEAIKESKVKLQIFIEESKGRAKSLDEQLQFAEDKRDKELAILKQELDAKKITQAEYDLAILKSKQEFLETQRNITLEYAQIELDDYVKNHQSKLKADTFFSEEALRIEQERLNGIADKRREFAQKQLEEGVLNQQQYNEAINAINEENRVALEEAQAEREEAKKEQQIVDLENERAANEENLAYDLEFQLKALEFKKQQEIEAARSTGADITLIEEKFAVQRKQIEDAVQQNKLQLVSSTFGNVAAVLGKESQLGKTAAIAQTTIDTYKAATSAYSAMSGIPIVGPALGAVAAAAAVVAGLANVRKIMQTRPPKAEQGALFDVGGNRHYAGGTKFYGEDGSVFEAEQGELIGVMNRRAAMMFKDFNDEYRGNSTSSRNFLAGGGFVQTSSLGRSQSVTYQSNSSIDYEQMAATMADAYSQVPPPVVAVEDINYGQRSYADVVSRADL